ncbi:MAG TPA: hypothetical protein VMU95_19355 [Trebonia sp.]|nr:hypothetical protein [Trebonia sp.]
MDPTIAAAWITGGVGGLGIAGTVATAIVGSRSTRKATETTVVAAAATTAATLAAAREDRLWDKQCAAYQEALSGLLHSQSKRQHDLRMYRLNEEAEQQIKDFLASYEKPAWFEAQGRLIAYASEAVLEAFKVAREADNEVYGRYQQWQMLAEEATEAFRSGRPGAVQEVKKKGEAHKATTQAIEEANAADEALIKLIRNELRSKPEAVVVPATAPAKRRRFWHRR